ncbi:MAG: hypothetical protein ACI9U2_002969 [Bradymonadia bacterium]|jgi:hypothetical protein
MFAPHPTLLTALLVTVPSWALAQGGNLGDGASTGSLVQLLLGLIAGLGLLIAIGLLLVRPHRDPPASLIGPAVIGLALSIPIVAVAVWALVGSASLLVGAGVALGLGAAYVAFIARRWRR